MYSNSEFRKYAIKHKGINGNTFDSYTKHNISNVTPYIIEERQLNVAQMDVFSRLMMDRIIFLGTGIDDQEVGESLRERVLMLPFFLFVQHTSTLHPLKQPFLYR